MRAWIAVAGAVLLGAALRLYPVWFALPYAQARPDETTAMGLAANVLAGDPNPHFFNWPSLTIYLFAGLFALASRVKGALGPDDYFLIARTGIALAGTATILLTARLARRAADASTSILAALFLAVAVLHVRDSHFATVDVLMTTLVTACLVSGLETMEAPSVSRYALTGLLGGLAASAKYSAAPIALTVFFLRPGGWPRGRELLAFTAAFAGGFLAGTPFSALAFTEFLRDVQFERVHLAQGHGAADAARGWIAHLQRSLPYGLGLPMFAAAIAGTGIAWVRYRRAMMPLAVFAVAYYAAIGSARTVFFRYTLPLFPLACLSAAIAVTWCAERLSSRTKLPRSAVMTALAVLVAAPSFFVALQLDRVMARPDSRQVAADWLMPQLTPDDTLYDSGDVLGLPLARANVHAWRYDSGDGTFVNAGMQTPVWLVLYESPLTLYPPPDAKLQAMAHAKYTLVHEVRGVGSAMTGVFDQQDAFFLPLSSLAAVARPGPDVLVYRRTGADR